MRYLIITFLFFLNFTLSQALSVKGKVMDSQSHEAIENVYIVEIDSNQTARSDANGIFSIKAPGKDSIRVQLFCLGYEKQVSVIPVNGETNIVKLKQNGQQLEEVQVIADRSPINYKSQYSMTTVNSNEIQENICSSLIDVLQTVPGMYKKSEYNSPLVLRGLSGKRLLVTKDGNRRMGNFSGAFMGQTVNVYDLERVDVIKGPASVKYGPGAIAGIINMVSKSAFATRGIHGRVLSSYGFNNQEKNILGGVSWSNSTQAVSVSGRYRTAEDFIYSNGKTADNSEYTDKDLSGSYAWRKNSRFTLVLETDLHFGGPWGRPKGFNGSQYILFSHLQDNSYHVSATAKWRPLTVAENIEFSLYYDKENRDQLRKNFDIGSGKLSYTEEVKYDNHYGGWRFQTDFRPFWKTKLSVGTDGVFYRISSPTTLTDYFQNYQINNRVAGDAGVGMGGVFAESETKLASNRLRWIIGVRADLANINEGSVHDTLLATGRNRYVKSYNGTTGIVYEAWKNIFMSFNAARACRMPDATEMFIETSNTDGMVYGNPSLKPEYGLNFDAGLRAKIGFATFDLSAFSNFLRDFISEELWLKSGKKGVNYRYENIDRSRIEGLEFSTQLRFSKLFFHRDELIYNGFVVYTEGHDLRETSSWFSQGKGLSEIPPLNTRHELTYRYRITSNWLIYGGVDWVYFAQQNEIPDNGFVSESYNLWGCSGGIEMKMKKSRVKCSMNTYNMTNVTYKPFESLIPGMGRNVKFLLSYSW